MTVQGADLAVRASGLGGIGSIVVVAIEKESRYAAGLCFSMTLSGQHRDITCSRSVLPLTGAGPDTAEIPGMSIAVSATACLHDTSCFVEDSGRLSLLAMSWQAL